LKIHFRAVATNVQTGEEVVFAMGNTGKAVRASCSIPGVFQPVRIGDKAYVDGGLVSHINSSDFDRRHEAILEGEKAAAEALPKILQILNKLRQEGRLT
jgi:predicted acylesterase/phospholipase RssA